MMMGIAGVLEIAAICKGQFLHLNLIYGSSLTMQNPPEDLPVPFEDISHAYTKLEPAYLKFLSECGMSKWGYWRGGSLE